MSGFGTSARNTGAALDRLDQGLLALTIVVAPLFMGGRHPVGRLVLVTLIGLQAVIWMWRQASRREAQWMRSPLLPLWIAAVGWVALQLAPLPPALLAKLSPHVGENLPLWSPQFSAVGLGEWNTISLTPVATLRGFDPAGSLRIVLHRAIAAAQDMGRYPEDLPLVDRCRRSDGVGRHRSTVCWQWEVSLDLRSSLSQCQPCRQRRLHQRKSLVCFLGLGGAGGDSLLDLRQDPPQAERVFCSRWGGLRMGPPPLKFGWLC